MMLPPSVMSGRAACASATSEIGAHVVGDAKRLAAGVHKFSFERGLGRERHRVQEQIQPAEFFADGFEDAGDFLVLRHVARQDERVRAKRAGEFLDVFLHAVALVREREFRALARPRLRDGPGNGALVGDTENNSFFLRVMA
jgi:hypothetical protein